MDDFWDLCEYIALMALNFCAFGVCLVVGLLTLVLCYGTLVGIAMGTIVLLGTYPQVVLVLLGIVGCGLTVMVTCGLYSMWRN